ncbi:MAG TPA: hypothetical protein PLG59_18690, partial [bacterium]|nr:hypothetical protein [bacterium]
LRETFVPAFLGRRSQVEGSAITLSSREAVQWTLDHLHPWDRSLFWDPDNLGRPASFMFWRVGQEGFIMRCFHLHPILVHPYTDYPDFPNTIDGSDFVKRVCPRRREVHVVEDSDEVMYFSIAPAEQSAELINRPRVDWRGVVTMVKACGLGSHNLYYLQRTIRFHVGEISDEWLAVERLSDVLVDQVRRAIDNPWKLAYYRLRLWVLSKIGAFLQTNPSFHRILKRTLGMIRTNKSI